MQTIKPAITTVELQAKFQSLKQNAYKEWHKHLDLLKSGMVSDKVG